MPYAAKIVLHSPLADPARLPSFVEACLADRVALIAVVGTDADKVEDLIDEIVVGDGSEPRRLIVTTSHATSRSTRSWGSRRCSTQALAPRFSRCDSSRKATRVTRMDVSTLHDMMAKLPDLVNRDAVLLRRGQRLDIDILIGVGDADYHASIAGGRIARLDRGPLLMRSWRLAFRGPDEAWRQFWQPFPPPHFHDIFALAKCGQLRIEGDFHPLMANLLYFKGMLAAPRRIAEGAR